MSRRCQCRPSGRLCWTIATIGLLASACTGSSDDQPDLAAIAAFERAVDAENGVPLIVADDTPLGELVDVRRHPDSDERDIWRFLARADDPNVPLVNVEIRPDVVFDDLRTDRLLSGGRAVEIDQEDSGLIFLRLKGQRNEFVQMSAGDVDLDAMLDLAGAMTVTDRNIDEMPTGWIEIGQVDLPFYEDGYSAIYAGQTGTSFITTTRVHGDVATYLAWSPADAVADDRFDQAWVIQVDALQSRYVVQFTDDITVEITGELSDEQFSEVVHNLRAAAAGEITIDEPDF